MTLRLILIRHAKSDWSNPGQDDHARPLNYRGRRDAPEIGRWLASRGDVPGLALCSTAMRAAETLALILPELPAPPQVQHSPHLYHASPEVMLMVLKTADAPVVLLVGHNPGIAALAALLPRAAPVTDDFRRYPTGATLVLDMHGDDWARVLPGQASVRDFFIPSRDA